MRATDLHTVYRKQRAICQGCCRPHSSIWSLSFIDKQSAQAHLQEWLQGGLSVAFHGSKICAQQGVDEVRRGAV